MRIILRDVTDHREAGEALRFAINLVESDHQSCAYQSGASGQRYFAERTITGVSCCLLSTGETDA